MGKIGRNAPCPCGSGKKYKKCCLSKDEQKSAQQSSQVKTQEEITENSDYDDYIPESSPVDNKIEYDDDDNWGIDDEFYDDENDLDWDDDRSMSGRDKRLARFTLPEISKQETALIDKWFEKYAKLKDADELKAHLDAFMTEYPHLVDHMELYQEALFKINAAFFRQNRHEEAAALLEKFRREFPLTYEQSHGYYDLDLIAYKIATGNKNEIPPLLNYFRANPDEHADNLFALIDLLKLCNCQEILQDFIPDIYVTVCNSDLIFGGDDIIEIVVALCFALYVKPDYTREDLEKLSAKLFELEVPMNKKRCSPESLEKHFKLFFQKVTAWNIDDCKTKEKIYQRYLEITTNFQGYLYSSQGMDWTAAVYYSDRINKYLYSNTTKIRKKGNPFIFSKDSIETTGVQLSRGLIGVNSIAFFGMLNAIFYFADYLYETESISSAYLSDIQKWCRELFEYAYPIQCQDDFEAIVFKQFPLEY